MKHNLWFARWLLCGLLVALGSSTSISADSEGEPASSPQDASIPPDCPVSNVIEAFVNIPEHAGFPSAEGMGEPFAFTYWDGSQFVGDDPSSMTHYQGAERVNGADGTPYLILTKNGNPLSGTHYPAELLIAQMGSREKSGESLHTNCQSIADEHCVLGENYLQDHVIYSQHFVNGYAPEATIGWRHVGSGQAVQGVLAVPLDKTCNSTDGGPCSGGMEDLGAIALIDVSDPREPQFRQISTYTLPSSPHLSVTFPCMAALGVTKNPEGDNYLFVVLHGDLDKVVFFESSGDDLRAPDLQLTLVGLWNRNDHDILWDKYQALDCVRDMDGSLFLIGTDQTGPFAGSENRVRLYEVSRLGYVWQLRYVWELRPVLDEPVDVLGDLDAVGSIYVSPTGRMILYTGPHDNAGWQPPGCTNPSGTELCKAYEMGEFASTFWEDAPPVTTHTLAGTLGEHDWYQSAVEVTLTASDTCGSGVQLTQYRLDDGAWQDYTSPFALSGGGRHTVRYHSQDNAGNWEAEKQASVRIDTTAPTGSIRLNDGAGTTPSALVRVYLPASDADSGVWQMRLRDAGGAWAVWQAHDPNVFWQLPNPATDQTYAVEVQFKDVAGHTSGIYSDAITLDIDPARPASASYRLANSTWGSSGSPASSASYRLQNTLGQPSMIGRLSSASYGLSSGFWAQVISAGPPYRVYLPLLMRSAP